MIRTARLRLTRGTAALTTAEMDDRAGFDRLLDAEIPENWPPEMLVDALPWFLEQLTVSPHLEGWYTWYAILERPGQRGVLVGGGGFKGAPDENGVAEIGYSVLPQFQRNGIASEMMRALVAWAFAQGGVRALIAEAACDNVASISVLHRLGFCQTGAGEEPESARFELTLDFFHLHKKPHDIINGRSGGVTDNMESAGMNGGTEREKE
jgi:RimJ/RimL family protein N-acetyltransferase